MEGSNCSWCIQDAEAEGRRHKDVIISAQQETSSPLLEAASQACAHNVLVADLPEYSHFVQLLLGKLELSDHPLPVTTLRGASEGSHVHTIRQYRVLQVGVERECLPHEGAEVSHL